MATTKMELFSRKHKLQRPSVDLIYDAAPTGVRTALLNLISCHLPEGDHNGWMELQKKIFESPQVMREFRLQKNIHLSEKNFNDIVLGCKWYSFFDILQLLSELFDTPNWKAHHSTLNREIFEKGINEIFTDNSLGYELRLSKIERVGSPYIDEVITQVRQVLQNIDYSGPNEQFEKAIGFLNQRPKPDTANCVKDAIGAIEGLARLLTGSPKLILSDILDREPLKSGIPNTLRQMMQKLYAYRGDAEGAGHGQTSTGLISIEEAELALGVSASCMIYLAKKFGKET